MKKKEKNFKSNKKRNKYILLIIVLFIVMLNTIFALLNSYNNKIIMGVYIENIDVSGFSEDKLKLNIENIVSKLKNKKIILKYEDYEKEIRLEELNVKYDFEDAINKAYLVGRNKNIILNNFEILKTMIYKEKISINLEYNKKILENKIKSIMGMIPNTVKEYNYYIENNNLIITNAKEGLNINFEELINNVEKEMKQLDIDNKIINIPMYKKEPNKLDIEKIKKEVCREPQDAYFDEKTSILHPNVDGIRFAIDDNEIKQILKENKEEFIIPLEIIKANKTINDLGEDAFPNVIGEFMTRYDPMNKNRSNNIELATNKINETIVMPGEIFSYNKIVGKRTIEAGYKEAGAYAGGKVIQEVGGGICQVSSTLYNSILYSNLEVIERNNHYFETSYVEPGRDATVSWGTLDLKFKNNRKYPIKINASSKNGVCKISINGIKEDDWNIVIKTEIIAINSKVIKYENNSNLKKGEEKVKQEGHDGCISKTYKIYFKNGIEDKKEELSSDYYHSLDKIIMRNVN